MSADQKSKSKVNLGIALEKMGLDQAAIVPLLAATEQGADRTKMRAMEVLARISILGGDTQLRSLALKRLSRADYSEITKYELELLRVQEFMEQENPDLDRAFALSEILMPTRGNRQQLLYLRGLILLQQNKPELAFTEFQKMSDEVNQQKILTSEKGLARLSMARAAYQAKKFPEAIELYREIPKDHRFYRESQMEMAWAYFRMAKFRSSLGAIQTVHTPFYENFWDPESYLVRAIIFLFICNADEANRSLDILAKSFEPVYGEVQRFLQSQPSEQALWNEVEGANKKLKAIKQSKRAAVETRLPFFLVRTLLESPTVKHRVQLLAQVQDQILKNRKNKAKQKESFTRYVEKSLNLRASTLRKDIAQKFKEQLLAHMSELEEIIGQSEFVRYETLNLQRKTIKSAIGKAEGQTNLESKYKRSLFVENGYRSWPFQGEYWRDEIGNAHYFGENRCEN
jgi:hypothetical protein